MIRYLVARALGALGILLLASMTIFVAVAASGDPLAQLRDHQPPVPQSVLDAEAVRLGLDDNLAVRYLHWLLRLVQGDFGPSVVVNRDIFTELTTRVGVTLRLVVVALVLALVLALVAGTAAAVRRGRWFDRFFTPLTFLLLALPSFWLTVIAKQAGILLNDAVGENVLPTVGAGPVAAADGFWDQFFGTAAHLVLPTLVLCLVHFSIWSRYQRSAVLESLQGDHVKFALVRGLARKRVIRSYAVRTSLVPIVTVVALELPVLVSGAIVTETVFQWEGMGAFLLDSISHRDMNAILGWLMIAGVAVVLCNLLADVLYLVIDPRIRHAA
ncbi:ABC transporter permease [Amycolatopsis jejuensis]|uniref:ABC transporter permease n=1 Tax=Amycolatopsis jejuensis TaxID=330084 RepID=UPI0005259D68|nr:ABC transporter permease [Amycolatopsis jejuensis]